VVSLSALRTGRIYSPGIIPGSHFRWRLSQPQDCSVAGRTMSVKNSSYTIGDRTRNLPACSMVYIRIFARQANTTFKYKNLKVKLINCNAIVYFNRQPHGIPDGMPHYWLYLLLSVVLYRVTHKSVKHFKNSQQIDYATDHGNSYADRERNSPSFFLHISLMLNVSTFGNTADIYVIVHLVYSLVCSCLLNAIFATTVS
jgi:hypothetical protein